MRVDCAEVKAIASIAPAYSCFGTLVGDPLSSRPARVPWGAA
ncbi:hypothetical protein [Oscillatoria sp. HE19RPO]|nr:hypothetical protein [Oscillatoria sp. HE19RPO]